VYHLAQLGVAAVAEGAVLGMFAAAPGHGSGFGQVHFERGKGGTFVRAIAKGLAFGLTTTAPIISARGGGQHERSAGRNFGFVHKATYSALLNSGNVFPKSFRGGSAGSQLPFPYWERRPPARQKKDFRRLFALGISWGTSPAGLAAS
jgi:hypothetical protein